MKRNDASTQRVFIYIYLFNYLFISFCSGRRFDLKMVFKELLYNYVWKTNLTNCDFLIIFSETEKSIGSPCYVLLYGLGILNDNVTQCITKTCLYNFDPLKPHFYIVKLGFTGVYIIFLISAQKHRLWVPTIYVLSRNMRNIKVFYLKIFSFWR